MRFPVSRSIFSAPQLLFPAFATLIVLNGSFVGVEFFAKVAPLPRTMGHCKKDYDWAKKKKPCAASWESSIGDRFFSGDGALRGVPKSETKRIFSEWRLSALLPGSPYRFYSARVADLVYFHLLLLAQYVRGSHQDPELVGPKMSVQGFLGLPLPHQHERVPVFHIPEQVTTDAARLSSHPGNRG